MKRVGIKNKRPVISFILSIIFVIGVMSGNGIISEASGAEDGSAPTSGKCGDTATWTYDEDGTLTISGTGKMWKYAGECDMSDDKEDLPFAPWSNLKSSIKQVKIEDGIESISRFAFAWCINMTKVEIGSGVKTIDAYGFYDTKKLKDVVMSDGISTIDDQAFAFSAIEKITLPRSIKSINCYVFYGCDKLKEITFAGSESEWKNLGGDGFIYTWDENQKINVKVKFLSDDEPSDETGKDANADKQAEKGSGDKSNSGSQSKYSSEWRDGKWYDVNGKQTYAGTLQWKSDATGWWVEDSAGWYPQDSWQKIDGTWYFFKPDGYMASNEYYNGYWFNADGSWDDKYLLSWKQNSTGWWVEDISGWWPSSSWLKIDGYWYYFDASGYMVTSQYVDDWWISADGVCY